MVTVYVRMRYANEYREVTSALLDQRQIGRQLIVSTCLCRKEIVRETELGLFAFGHMGFDFGGGLGGNSGLLQITKIAKPVDKSVLPSTEWNTVSIRQAASMPASAVEVCLDVRHTPL